MNQTLSEVINEDINITNMTDTRLWNPRGFLYMSFFFSFLPGAILSALNFGRMNKPDQRNKRLFLSIIGFVILVGISFFVPQQLGKSMFQAINIFVGVWLKMEQEKMFQDHIENGGAKASYIIPVVISIALTSIVAAAMISTINVPDKKMLFKNDELFYTEAISETDVKKLGSYLIEAKVFKDDEKVAAAKVDKTSEKYILSFIVSKENQNKQEIKDGFKAIAQEISANVFNGKKVEIDFCNDKFDPETVVNY